MKTSFQKCLIILTMLIFFLSCENSDISQLGKPDNSQQIGFREPDPNCEVCSEISVSYCCCFVESVEQTTDIDLHICGVLAPINELCAGTGHGCYAVGTSGIHV